MKICLISREYPSDFHAGGAGTYTEKTARALAALGQTVTVITEASGNPSIQVEDGVEVRRLAPARLIGPVKVPYTRTFARARSVAREVQRLPDVPDIVQACEFGAEAFWYAGRKHPSTRLVTRLATPEFLVAELSSGSGGRTIRTRYSNWMERTQTGQSDAIISPSAALADIVCRRWGIARDRVTIVRTGVDFAERYAGQAAELPAELKGHDYVLYFGRLEERKGVHILADALPEVLAAHPQLHFVFAGNNFLTYKGQPMQAYVERRNAKYLDRVHFLPRLPQRQLYPVIQSSLFVVLPSLWESLANATLEALDMGKPVVATLGGGFAEVLEDRRSGVLVPPGDAPALRDALLWLQADRGRLSQMSEQARARAECFRLPRVAARLLDFYEGLGLPPDGHHRRRATSSDRSDSISPSGTMGSRQQERTWQDRTTELGG
jgi:glycosyltransferase involved in cell wall biosynthesis